MVVVTILLSKYTILYGKIMTLVVTLLLGDGHQPSISVHSYDIILKFQKLVKRAVEEQFLIQLAGLYLN